MTLVENWLCVRFLFNLGNKALGYRLPRYNPSKPFTEYLTTFALIQWKESVRTRNPFRVLLGARKQGRRKLALTSWPRIR